MPKSPKRRKVHFSSIAEAVADAEQLAAGEVKTTGHYSFGQILEHIARAMDTVTGKVDAGPVALPIRIAARIGRSYILSHPVPAGYKLPGKSQSILWPSEDVDVSAGLTSLKQAIERFETTEPLRSHPVLGNLNRKQHEQMQCRHSELHLSFVHPVIQ